MAKRGRPSIFKRETAVVRAMELFWARGYEGATLEDLQSAMGGISPPSFYNAFGSKEALFKEAVDLFVETVGAPGVRALNDASTAREGVAALLRHSAESRSQPRMPHGCLLVLGAAKCAPANQGPQDYLTGLRRQAPRVIKARLQRGAEAGELGPQVDLDALAAFYATVIHGIGVRAGDGATRRELLAVAAAAMAAWPERAGARGQKQARPKARG